MSCYARSLSRFAYVITLIFTLCIVSSCIKFESVQQPIQAKTGQIIQVPIIAYQDEPQGNPNKPYLGIHLPDGWSVIEPVPYQGSFTGNLTYDPESAAEAEANYPEDGYYWWVGKGISHQPIEINAKSTANLQIQVGNQPGFFELDYRIDIKSTLADDVRENLAINVTTDYGSSWQSSRELTGYVLASHITSLNFPLTLINLGEAGGDRFTLSAAPPTGWSANFLANGTPTNITAPSSFNQSIPIELRLTIPVNVSLGEYTIPVQATSVSNPNATALTTVKVVVFGPKGITPPQAFGVELIGRVGSHGSFLVKDDYLYIAEGTGLAIWDLSNPAAPTKLGQTVILPSSVKSLYVDGSYAYLSLSNHGLRIIDISNPTNPTEVSYFPVKDDQKARQLIVNNNYVYMATKDGLYIIDVSNPFVPVEQSFINVSDQITKMALKGNYLYISSSSSTGGNLIVIDISSPTLPIQLVAFDLSNTSSGPYKIAVVDDYVYLEFDSGLEIVDISQPSMPIEVGGYDQADIGDIAISGNYAYLSIYNSAQLKILNISNPTTPIEVASYPVSGEFARGLSVVNNHAYVWVPHGIEVVNISNPAQPMMVSTILMGSYPEDVVVADQYAYLATYAGLQIADISNPGFPSVVGVIGERSRDALAVSENYAYIGSLVPGGGGQNNIEVVDISEPTSPSIVALVENGFNIEDVEVANNFIYTAKFSVIDISNPIQPIKIDVPYLAAENIAVQGNYAYLATALDGMRIIDISNPYDPVEVGFYDWSTGSDSYTPGLDVSGNYAYLSNLGKGFHVVDISNPSAPVRVGLNEQIGDHGDLKVVGDRVYLVSYQGLIIIDVSDPSAPKKIGYYNTSRFGSKLDVVNDYIYWANSSEGLLILHDLKIDPQYVYLPLIAK